MFALLIVDADQQSQFVCNVNPFQSWVLVYNNYHIQHFLSDKAFLPFVIPLQNAFGNGAKLE